MENYKRKLGYKGGVFGSSWLPFKGVLRGFPKT